MAKVAPGVRSWARDIALGNSSLIHTNYYRTRDKILTMSKQLIFPVFLGLLILGLTGCIIGGGDEETAGPAEGETPATTVEVPAPTATAVPPTPVPAETQVATEGELFLQMIEPTENEIFTESGTLTVTGRTRVDAVVTINDTIVEPNIDGEFSLDVTLEEGPNIIEVVTSVASGEQMDQVLVALYVP